ncbi:initiation factor 2B related protein [Thermosphaera aggregans DSM 11486]|jgi:translation initiation factor eIF-2B subunit delta|uniref:Translation initiation factor eIF2B subunit delta n=1 Tax=Thermosphaera aggregans (strain DSM 11486 / M11TL) TaxID=633148 RepID=D5U1E9_THEAM|nr:initiation factor 2B related protein [Thermosphaera aggregans DSM 11486]
MYNKVLVLTLSSVRFLEKDLVKHGFKTRYTGSEIVFATLETLKEYSLSSDEKNFAKQLLATYEKIVSERPASAGVLNILRTIIESFLRSGLQTIPSVIMDLKSSYEKALWTVADVACKRVSNGDVLMTNSNSLAVRRFFARLKQENIEVEVYVPESRPGLEGLLLAEYLEELGFNVNLIVDSAMRYFMKNVDKVFMGAEAVAANGAVVSKAGSSLMALAAKEARVRVYVLAPLLKFSFESVYGEMIKLPEGGWELLMDAETRNTLPENYSARAPIYDVTPPDYIDAIATEYGIFSPQAIPILLREIYGSYPPSITPLPKLVKQLEEAYHL